MYIYIYILVWVALFVLVVVVPPSCPCFVGCSCCLLFSCPLLCSLSESGICVGSIPQFLPVLFEISDVLFLEQSFPIELLFKFLVD